MYNWANFIQRIERGRVNYTKLVNWDTTDEDDQVAKGVLNVADLLQFATGARAIPSSGFPRTPELIFDHSAEEGRRITANTCAIGFTIPVNKRYLCSLEDFTQNMVEDIISAPTFGMV